MSRIAAPLGPSQKLAPHPAVVRVVGEPQDQGDVTGLLVAPFRKTFNGIDAPEGHETFGARDADGRTATLEGPLGELELGGDPGNGGGSKSVVQDVTEQLPGERITPSLHAVDQVVDPSDVDAPEDCRMMAAGSSSTSARSITAPSWTASTISIPSTTSPRMV